MSRRPGSERYGREGIRLEPCLTLAGTLSLSFPEASFGAQTKTKGHTELPGRVPKPNLSETKEGKIRVHVHAGGYDLLANFK